MNLESHNLETILCFLDNCKSRVGAQFILSLYTVSKQETHHEMRIPERDLLSVLFTYLRLSIDIH